MAVLLDVGCESYNDVYLFYKPRFSQEWPYPVTFYSVSLLLGISIKPTINHTSHIPKD